MTDKQTEALKLALEALEYISSHYMSLPKIGCMALAAIEEALAEQPYPDNFIDALKYDVAKRDSEAEQKKLTPYMIHAHGAIQRIAPRKPLTDEQLRVIENKINPNMRWRSSDEEGITLYPQEYYELVRAIEAAHGIKGEA